MRAVRCGAEGVEVVDLPAPAGDGVRVRVRSAGICGSDLHMVGGGFPLAHTLGHEMAGELSDGTPVAIEPLAPCGECEFCRSGEYNLCRLGPAVTYGVGLDGGMADEIIVPERSLVRLPTALPVRDACLVEPLAVAVHGLRKVGYQPGLRSAIIGGGTIGLCALAAIRGAGGQAGLVARHDQQCAAGERLGACEAAGEHDLVVESAGTLSALEQAVALCRPGGTILLLACYWEGLTLPGFAVCLKEISIIPSSMYSQKGLGRDVDLAAALLASRPEVAETLITHRLPLDAAAEAFAIAGDRKAGAIKVVLEP